MCISLSIETSNDTTCRTAENGGLTKVRPNRARVIGRDPFDADGLHAAMNRAIAPSFSTGQPICKAGVDLALFDLTGKLINQWAFDHTMTIADGDALVALDMYEHAYHMDFGAKAAAYVDAYMGALDWANADQVFAKAGAKPT